MENDQKWEKVSNNGVTEVCRHQVEGGWLYSVTAKGATTFTTTFVPDIDLQRYQAHLRDAYKKGYDDGHNDCKQNVKAILE